MIIFSRTHCNERHLSIKQHGYMLCLVFCRKKSEFDPSGCTFRRHGVFPLAKMIRFSRDGVLNWGYPKSQVRTVYELEILLKWMIWGVPLLWETPIYVYYPQAIHLLRSADQTEIRAGGGEQLSNSTAQSWNSTAAMAGSLEHQFYFSIYRK